MSLFTNDLDRVGVPPLTKFLQVAVPADLSPESLVNSEVEQFLRIEERDPEWRRPIRWGNETQRKEWVLAEIRRQGPGLHPLVQVPSWIRDEVHQEAWLLSLAHLGRFHGLALRIAEWLTDTSFIKKADVIEFRDHQMVLIRRSIDAFIPRIHPVPFEIENVEEPISPEQLSMTLTGTYGVSPTGVRLIEDLALAISRPDSFRRCIVCSSPFVVTRTDHVLCSHRCGNRRRMRLQRLRDREKRHESHKGEDTEVMLYNLEKATQGANL